MTYKLFSCWDCGVQIVKERQGNLLPNLREVVFELSDGSRMRSPFCVDCAEREWTPERLAAFKAAIDHKAGKVRPVQIVRAEQAPQTSGGRLGVLT